MLVLIFLGSEFDHKLKVYLPINEIQGNTNIYNNKMYSYTCFAKSDKFC